MKRIWLAVFTATAVLFGTATVSLAQGMMMGGSNPYGYPPQAYMMMPAANPTGAISPVAYAAAGPGCVDGCTKPGCTAPGCTSPGGCSDPALDEYLDGGGWNNCYFAYGGFMYLRARDSEVAYAVTANGPITPGSSVVQRSDVGVVDQNYRPGFFVGIGKTLDECSSIGVQYTNFESNATNSIATTPPFVIRSLVAHPSTFNAASDGLAANASQDIRFDLGDIDYRNLFAYDVDYKINYIVGVRFAQLKQAFDSQFQFNGTQSVNTNVNFYGAGVRLGLEGERYARRGFMCYGKTHFSAIPGVVHANYTQTDAFGAQQVNTGYNAGRIATIADLELGVGWRNQCDNIRLTVGYMFARWGNVMQTNQWINSVQHNSYINMNNNMTFDGLIARFEARW